MGSSRWNPSDYADYSNSTAGMDAGTRFSKSTTASSVLSGATAHLNPAGVKTTLNPTGSRTRESRDSEANPNSTPVIVALDVTGSMGRVINELAGKGMGTLFNEILERKPVTDPHLMFMGIGDVYCDQVPLQVSQFEADNRIVDQLTDLYLEGGGGGNRTESYNLPWYYAATHTQTDAFEKRGKKGYLFTVGDEESPNPLTRADIKRVIGDDVEKDFTNAELLTMVGRTYEVFHVVIGQGDYASHSPEAVRKTWAATLGERVLWLKDHTKLAEVVVSAIEVIEGRTVEEVVNSWSGDTSVVVRDAMKGLMNRDPAASGVTRF